MFLKINFKDNSTAVKFTELTKESYRLCRILSNSVILKADYFSDSLLNIMVELQGYTTFVTVYDKNLIYLEEEKNDITNTE